jgi:hypothetical protein
MTLDLLHPRILAELTGASLAAPAPRRALCAS